MINQRWSLRKSVSFIIVLLISLNCIISFNIFIVASESDSNPKGNIIFVDQSNFQGPWTGSEQHPLQRISEAIELAESYDTVIIHQGIYNESIELTFPIYLIGIQSPVIDGDYCHKVISIYSSDVFISNLRIIHSDGFQDDAGMYIDGVTNVTISDCIFHHTKTGIYLNNSTNILINKSWFFHSGNAIKAKYSSGISIQGCDFARNSISLLMQESKNIALNWSTFTSNGMSGYFDHSLFIHINRCNVTDNSVNKGGFFFSDSTDINITSSLFQHNGVGISFSNVTRANVSSCNLIRNTHFALSFRNPSTQILISHCLIQQNIRNGIYIESGNIICITHSHITDNTLYSIIANPTSICDAQMNYWGHQLGPWYALFQRSNKLSVLQTKIIISPWQKTPFFDVGIQTKMPSLSSNHTFDEQIIINCEEVDTDSDNIPDWWEKKWGYSPDQKNDHVTLDPDNDGLNNIQEWFTDSYGSHPFKKDVFLELDWMYCDNGAINKPDINWLQPIIDSYDNYNISLHIDIGNLGGGEEIFYDCQHIPTYAALEDMYWKFFLNNDLQNPRKEIFHYGLLCNFCPDLNFPFVGWNALDSFAISVEWLSQTYPHYQRQQLIAGGIAHHLGHTLGLIADTHLGIDNIDTLQFFSSSWWNFLQYHSCMNYFYKYRVFTFSDGLNGNGDFNDWENLDFSFFQRGIYEQR